MIRETSREAYEEIKRTGLLSQRRLQVFGLLFEHGPATGSEIAVEFKKQYSAWMAGGSNMNIVTRLGELRDSGCVKELPSRRCNVTGQTAMVWDVTSKLPKKLIKQEKTKCRHCNGRGYFIQTKLDL